MVKQNKKIKLLLTVFLIGILSIWIGCNNIEGVYVANHNYGYDTLKIYSEKFIRIYYTPDKSESFADTGTWKISDGRIDFRDWVNRCEESEHFMNKGKIIFGTDVNKNWLTRSIILPINYDAEYYYEKIK